MATGCLKEELPPVLDSSSEPPSLFDGTTRLYISLTCPYAQRAWIARNYKGLQDKVKLVPIDLQNRPSWYKEKVYSPNKVPSLEHNNEVRGESLDLLKYIDTHFEGPALLPDDPVKREFTEELLAYTDTFNNVVMNALMSKEIAENEVGTGFDYIESALSKFDDGPYILGQFSLLLALRMGHTGLVEALPSLQTLTFILSLHSYVAAEMVKSMMVMETPSIVRLPQNDFKKVVLVMFTIGFESLQKVVDIAYAPFIERCHPLLLEVKKYDLTIGRPKLASWIEEMNKIDAYTQTKYDINELIEIFKTRFLGRM